jgi:hypothetical protein
MLHVAYGGGSRDVHERRAGRRHPAGEWVQYSTPGDEGAESMAVCLPAFSPATFHRDD